MNTLEATLQSLPLFSSLTHEQIVALTAMGRIKNYRTGDYLFYEGDPCHALTILIEGSLQVFKSDPRGNEITIHRFSPVAMIAEAAALEGIAYPASARFLSDGRALIIDKQAFVETFLSDPRIAGRMISSLTHKIRRLEQVISGQLTMDATGRVAAYLITHAATINREKHKDVAQTAGVTPETLSRIVTRFRQEGILEGKWGELTIKNLQQLKGHVP